MTDSLPSTGFRHEAAVYHGDQGFLDVTVDYVREGLAAGEPVVVAVIPPKIDLLRAALGPAAERVRFIDMAQAGRNPARIIPLWRQMVQDSGGTPIRGIGEPVWSGRRPDELAEALLHEALLNLAFADNPDLLLRCPYDAQALGEELVAHAHRRHPTVVLDGVGQCGQGYPGAAEAAAEFATPLPAVPAQRPLEHIEFDEPFMVRKLRDLVAQHAGDLGIVGDRAADLALAVHEIAVNSLRHGGGRGVLRIWRDEVSLVCEISDDGLIDQPLVGRLQPAVTQLSGRGVWLANQLCDLVQVRSSAAGTTVRLHMAL